MATRELVVAALLATSAPAAADDWTTADYALESTFAALLVVDYVQTRAITADGLERNPIMGAHGDGVPPELYFPAVAVTHAIVMAALPRTWRRVAQGISIGVQASTVRLNWHAGYSLSF